ncbi:phytoene synthase [Haloferula luteola]|uniref:Phytoene synthase n=1 Tax=Haloferula luteola TaxID=595692 RepID=A0A840VC76_9BACT|nr:phytoene/squalene synthase family protein [Haloferula luteola]MBB5350461.1 phytoene synthase [Haloferula luteola]
MSEAADITKQAKSNLAFALNILPKDRRDDAVIFYAFCRVIDDLADDLSQPVEIREAGLEGWLRGLREGFEQPDDLQRQILGLQERRKIPSELLAAIVEGCRMDLRPQRFESWDELSEYTWRVACAVGLVAMRIFGARSPKTEHYAVSLGHALQITNILRDVGEDWANGGRIYLPLSTLRAHGYTEEDLAGGIHDERFIDLMRAEADRADGYFAEAARSLPEEDRATMVAAEIMRAIYSALLDKMRRDRFQVFSRRYRLSKARKLAIFSKHLIGSGFSPE